MQKRPKIGYAWIMKSVNDLLTDMESNGHLTYKERHYLEVQTQRFLEDAEYRGGYPYRTAAMAAIALVSENLGERFVKKVGPFRLGEPAYFKDFYEVPTRQINRLLNEFRHNYLAAKQKKVIAS